MDLAQAASTLLAPLGFEVLELNVTERGGSRRVLLRIDRLDEARVSIEDVATASEAFGLELDRLDPFDSPYRLEVESPGAKRPLTRARHFERFHDLKVKVRVGAETFTGIVREVDGERIAFEVQGERRVHTVAEIDSARLAQWPDEPR